MDPGATNDNPLLAPPGFPPFDRIRPEHVVPGVQAVLAELEARFEQLEAEARPEWAAIMEPMERIADALGFHWGVPSHLMSVRNSPELRAAHEEVQPRVVEFSMKLAQSQTVFQNLKTLQEAGDGAELDTTRRRIVDCHVRDAQLSGVGLEGQARERFNAIQLDLAELATKFSNNVLDATKAFALTLRAEDDVAGLPPSLRQLAAQAARAAGEEGATEGHGPWRITLDGPSYQPFMKHSPRRDLREALYRAQITRASSGELDNTPLLERILVLRKELAGLLGYATFAEVSLATKMAPDVAAVDRLLEDLRLHAHGAARRDLDELRALARERGAPEAGDFQLWDAPYWSEELRRARFDFSDEELRPYFQLPRVLDGLFALTARLFGVRVVAADGQVPTWHPDVRFFRVEEDLDESDESHAERGLSPAADAERGRSAAADAERGLSPAAVAQRGLSAAASAVRCSGRGDGPRPSGRRPIAWFYLDPYSRPAEKRGGAWMNAFLSRSRLLAGAGEDVRAPVAVLVCNGTPPVDGRPSLMTFDEVHTLFHEFGHGLQHMLTTVDESMAAGVENVEWDAVELASQFMENWCYQRETLIGLSAHVETGAPLSDEVFEKILAAKNFQIGSRMLRQICFGMTDMELHARFVPGGAESPLDVRRRIAARTSVLAPPAEDRFLNAFGHVFAGGYAAGYFSYYWAEVLSADAFAAFEEAGLDDTAAVRATGRRYRDTVLALGGSRPAMEVFRAFRGREPSTAALLRHSGFTDRELPHPESPAAPHPLCRRGGGALESGPHSEVL